MKNIINENTVNGSSNIITGNTTLAELISILGPVTRAAKTPTSKALREEAGEPIASSPDPLGYGDGILVYSNGYAVYDNGSGRTVVWVPACTSFNYYFDKMKESEKGGEIKETFGRARKAARSRRLLNYRRDFWNLSLGRLLSH